MVYVCTMLVKKRVMFVAAASKMAAMVFKIPDATRGWVRINHKMSARKRNPTILLKFTDNHRSAPGEGPLTHDLYRTNPVGGTRRAGPCGCNR
jgi:hypothetical protein